MRYNSTDAERKAAFDVANLMCAAARTAPKGCGIDAIETAILDGAEKDALAAEMRKMATEFNADFYERDGNLVDKSFFVVLLGVRKEYLGFDCGLCGLPTCADCVAAGANCCFKTTDLGIAVGSAVSVAADHRIDNRVLMSAGQAAIRIGVFGKDVTVCWGIPLAVMGKNPWFDREAAPVIE